MRSALLSGGPAVLAWVAAPAALPAALVAAPVLAAPGAPAGARVCWWYEVLVLNHPIRRGGGQVGLILGQNLAPDGEQPHVVTLPAAGGVSRRWRSRWLAMLVGSTWPGWAAGHADAVLVGG